MTMLYADFLIDVVKSTAGPVHGSFRRMLRRNEIEQVQQILHLISLDKDNTYDGPETLETENAASPGTSSSIGTKAFASAVLFALEVYEHFVLRKGRYFRVNDARRYLPSAEQNEVTIDHGVVEAQVEAEHLLNSSLELLRKYGLIHFPFSTGCDHQESNNIAQDILFGDRCILSKAELLQLAGLLGLNTSKLAGVTKASLLDRIQSASQQQRTLFGGRVSLFEPLGKIFSSAVKYPNTSDKKSSASSSLLILDTGFLNLVRMLHRVHSITSSPQHGSHLSCPNDGLMVRFRKWSFEPYDTNIAVQDLFSSRESFDEYEQALTTEASIVEDTEDCERCSIQDSSSVSESDSEEDSDCICLGSSPSMSRPSEISILDGDRENKKAQEKEGPYKHIQRMCIICATDYAIDNLGSSDDTEVFSADAKIVEYPWLKQFQATSVYARIVWHGVAELERCREYNRAIECLQLLLHSKCAPHRRGRMWIRLLVDAKHQWNTLEGDNLNMMLKWCQEALKDPHVRGGDRLTVEKKFATLCSKRKARDETNSVSCTMKGDPDSDSDFEPPAKRRKAFKRHTKNLKLNESKQQRNPSSLELKEICKDNSKFVKHKGERPRIPFRFIIGRPTNKKQGQKSRFLDYGDGNPCTVESLCLQNYRQPENGSWEGIHCEGSPIRTLFFLLLWSDVVFCPSVPGAFLTHFQDSPLDLDTAGAFSFNRRDQLRRALQEISMLPPCALIRRVRQSWCQNYGKSCRGVNWWVDLRLLATCAAAIGGQVLSEIFRTLADDYHHFCGGLPDLFLWRWNKSNSNSIDGLPGEASKLFEPSRICVGQEKQSSVNVEASASPFSMYAADLDAMEATIREHPHGLQSKFVEVKGPRDTLMARQEIWLQTLFEATKSKGCPCSVEICHVQEKSWEVSCVTGPSRENERKRRNKGKEAQQHALSHQ